MAGNEDDVLQGLESAFKSLQPDDTGRIPYTDVVKLLTEGGYDLSDVEISMLMCQFDLDHDGGVDYHEWLAALLDWQEVQQSKQWEQWVRKVRRVLNIQPTHYCCICHSSSCCNCHGQLLMQLPLSVVAANSGSKEGHCSRTGQNTCRMCKLPNNVT